MTTTPAISVVIPAYNAASFVEQTLQSVFSQTFRDTEVIVVDDGSTDNTRAVLQKYSDRIRYVYKENGGQSSARNAGIRIAGGEYIALLDHDDMWLENKLELQLREMNRSKTTGLVTCGSVSFVPSGDTGTEIPRLNHLGREQLLSRLVLENCMGSCSKTLIRSDCFRSLGMFDESLHMAEDWEMWFRIAGAYDIRSVELPLVRYRIHPGNRSSSSGEINLANELIFLGRVFAKSDFRRRWFLKRQAFSNRYLHAAIAARESSDMPLVRRRLLRAILYYPPSALRKTSLALGWFGLVRSMGQKANRADTE